MASSSTRWVALRDEFDDDTEFNEHHLNKCEYNGIVVMGEREVEYELARRYHVFAERDRLAGRRAKQRPMPSRPAAAVALLNNLGKHAYSPAVLKAYMASVAADAGAYGPASATVIPLVAFSFVDSVLKLQVTKKTDEFSTSAYLTKSVLPEITHDLDDEVSAAFVP